MYRLTSEILLGELRHKRVKLQPFTLVWKFEGNGTQTDPSVGRNGIFKRVIKSGVWGCGLDSSGSVQVPGAGYFKQCNEHLVSMKEDEFVYQLCDCQLIKDSLCGTNYKTVYECLRKSLFFSYLKFVTRVGWDDNLVMGWWFWTVDRRRLRGITATKLCVCLFQSVHAVVNMIQDAFLWALLIIILTHATRMFLCTCWQSARAKKYPCVLKARQAPYLSQLAFLRYSYKAQPAVDAEKSALASQYPHLRITGQ